jgi:hypothetical protein
MVKLFLGGIYFILFHTRAAVCLLILSCRVEWVKITWLCPTIYIVIYFQLPFQKFGLGFGHFSPLFQGKHFTNMLSCSNRKYTEASSLQPRSNNKNYEYVKCVLPTLVCMIMIEGEINYFHTASYLTRVPEAINSINSRISDRLFDGHFLLPNLPYCNCPLQNRVSDWVRV